MAKKRRMFDIEMPEDDGAETFPAGKVVPEPERRRGPMATAIGETADSSRRRHELEMQIRAENDALAHEHVRLKKLGLVVELIPVNAVEMRKLVRDRSKTALDPDLEGLMRSIQSTGLSNPIRVEEAGQGRYELIQGYRRLSAYRALLEETGDDRYATIPAAVSATGDDLEMLYRRMVDENLVRKDISFFEMAQLALDYAADPETEESDADRAVALLFKSASYQKRSYIRNFIPLVRMLGEALNFATDIPRALGLVLARRLEEDDHIAAAIRNDLSGWENRSVKDELEVLRKWAGQGDDDSPAPVPRAPSRTTSGKAKTSFQMDRREGRAKCTAADGRLEIRLARDFSTIDRRKLEEAVRRMLDQLD